MKKFTKIFAVTAFLVGGVMQLSAAVHAPNKKLSERFEATYMGGAQAPKMRVLEPRKASGFFEPRKDRVTPAPVKVPMRAPGDINLLGWISAGANYSYGYINRIPYHEGGTFSPLNSMTIFNSLGGVESNGLYYTVVQNAVSPTMAYSYLYAYDSTTWMYKSFKSLEDFSLFATAQATDPNDGTVYGCYFNADRTGYEFGSPDFENATRSTIATINPEKPWAGCAVDAEGTVYAIDLVGDLYTVDKTDGAMTFVGATGLTTEWLTGACYDIEGGRILFAVCNPEGGESGLHGINPATAESELLCSFPYHQEVMGLFIGAPLADPKAPEAPASIEASFPEGGLEGSFSFTVPTTTFDGGTLEGEVEWTMTAFYNQTKTGKANPGEKVEVPFTAPYSGNTTVTVSLSNEAGSSPTTTATVFIGKGTPSIPVPYLDVKDNVVTITWAPVTQSIDGGYLDPEEVVYTLTRFPDRTVIAEKIKETTWTDVIPMPDKPTRYSYQLVAEYGDKMSGLGQSLGVILGTQKVPYDCDLSTFDGLTYCTVLNANEDDHMWVGNGIGATIVDYSGNFDADDWLFTPGIELEKGKAYYASFSFNSYPNDTFMFFDQCGIEIKYGTGTSPEEMTTVLKPLTPIDQLSSKPVTGIVRPDADGKCYLGVHAKGQNTNWIQMTRIQLKDAGMPDSVKNLSIEAGVYPSLTAKVKFDAPSVNAAGDPISSLSKIEVMRGGVIIKTIENPSPGETIEFDDVVGTNVYASGNYQWIVTAFNEIGEGISADRIVYIGLDAPARPETFDTVEKDNTGVVTLSWSPVTTDVHGRPLAPEYIHYNILNSGSIIDDKPEIVDNTYTYKVCEPEDQDFCQMGLQLYNERSSSVVYSAPLPVGKPYNRYVNSFADTKSAHPIALFNAVEYGMWTVTSDGYYNGCFSADGDNGFVMLAGNTAGVSSCMHLGKFNLDGLKSPALSFKLMNVWDGEHDNNNFIDVIADTGDGWRIIATLICSDIQEKCLAGEYVKRSVDLSPLVGKGDIHLGIRGTLVDFQLLPLDDIRVLPVYDNNLTAVAVTAPSHIRPGVPASVNVKVENNGRKDAGSFTVTLSRDGKEVLSEECDGLEPDGSVNVEFTDMVDVLSPEQVTYTASVTFAADEDESDNTTEPVTVTVDLPAYPAPEQLAAVCEDGKVNLTWSEPVPVLAADPVTEEFEQGDAYAVDNYGDWTFLDLDGANCFSMTSAYYEGMEGPAAWTVFQPTSMDLSYFGDLMRAHSGDRYLASIGNSENKQNDDWAISPALSGEAQTVSFYARSLFIEDGGESFRFLYSTTGTDPDDFIEVKRVDVVPAAWTLYQIELPEGAKYFAINCVSLNQYMLMVDDVTFTPEALGAGVELLGYNVYRDGVRLNSEANPEPSFSDSPEADGSYSYTVTALYDKGESVGSNVVEVAFRSSSLSEAALAGVLVNTRKGEITVAGADGLDIRVFAVDGKAVASLRGTSFTTINVPAGVYVVTAGSMTVKVLVP